jgi:hypothetical protein
VGAQPANAPIAFVEKFTPLQKNFAFRYPEKMEEVDLGDFTSTLRKTNNIIRDIDVGLKIKGYNLADAIK